MHRHLLPFYDERKCKIDMIVIHCEIYPIEDAIKVFTERKVSSHYIIDENGEIWQLVGEKHRAWHAGVSSWQGQSDINSRSIGIELVSPTLGQKSYAKAQKEALCALLQRLIKKYKITSQNIVGHSDVAPTRKADPNKSFFWKELNQKGVGIFYQPRLKNISQRADIAQLLQIIGYDTADLAAAKLAFCRRFIPQAVAYEKDIWNIEKNLPQTAKNFKEPKELKSILQNIAQQYESASNTPCKM